jgi:hypothetical protein
MVSQQVVTKLLGRSRKPNPRIARDPRYKGVDPAAVRTLFATSCAVAEDDPFVIVAPAVTLGVILAERGIEVDETACAYTVEDDTVRVLRAGAQNWEEVAS